MEGYLRKKNKTGFWQRRFFKLCGSELQYFKGATTEEPLGSICIPDAREIRTSDRFGAFDVVMQDREYNLKASDVDTAAKWLHAIRSTQPDEPTAGESQENEEAEPSPRKTSVAFSHASVEMDSEEAWIHEKFGVFDGMEKQQQIEHIETEISSFFVSGDGSPGGLVDVAEASLQEFKVVAVDCCSALLPEPRVDVLEAHFEVFDRRLLQEIGRLLEFDTLKSMDAGEKLRLITFLGNYTAFVQAYSGRVAQEQQQEEVGQEEARQEEARQGVSVESKVFEAALDRWCDATEKSVLSYAYETKEVMDRWCSNFMSQSLEANSFIKGEDGYMQTSGSVDLFNMVNEQMGIVEAQSSKMLRMEVLDVACKCLVDHQRRLTYQIKGASPDGPAPKRSIGLLCAIVNDNAKCMDEVTLLQEQYEAAAEEYEREHQSGLTEHLDEMEDAFAKAGSACIQVLVDEVFEDLEDTFAEFFTAPWHTGEEELMALLAATLSDYFDDFKRELLPFFFEQLAGEALDRVVVEYISALVNIYRDKSSKLAKFHLEGTCQPVEMQRSNHVYKSECRRNYKIKGKEK
jgi:hypothetical protein